MCFDLESECKNLHGVVKLQTTKPPPISDGGFEGNHCFAGRGRGYGKVCLIYIPSKSLTVIYLFRPIAETLMHKRKVKAQHVIFGRII